MTVGITLILIDSSMGEVLGIGHLLASSSQSGEGKMRYKKDKEHKTHFFGLFKNNTLIVTCGTLKG